VDIHWTRHASERQQEWEKRLGIARADIERILANPEQVVRGDRGVWVAQAHWGEGLIRIPFTELQQDRKVLTIYWTSKVERYWKEK
jgi:hypothetical protein